MSTDVPQSHAPASSSPDTTPPLPDDPEILKRMIMELLGTLHNRDRECEQLRHRLEQLLRRLYGPRAEKFDPNQPWLFPELSSVAPATAAAEQTAPPVENATVTTPKKGHGRRRLPDSLPRLRVVHDVPEQQRACPECGQERHKIGEDISEQLDYQPASLFVIEHVRCSYACPHCQGQVTTADKPSQPIDKGLPGPGLLAHIITSKYADHLPLHRQERIFARHGLELPRSTTCDWMAACADVLRPLYARMVQEVLRSRMLHTDDTVLPVQDETRDTTRQGRLWVYAGDRSHPYNVFDYTPTRARDGPQRFLTNFEGYLQADAFGGYDGIYLAARGAIVEVACNAHARRKFYDAQSSDAARSHAALAWYRQLYALEKEAKERIEAEHLDGTSADALRVGLRQEKALPLWSSFRTWLEEQRDVVLPKSPMGQAISYTISNWDALVRYTEAGFLAIDNNVAEREMKKIAIGRKNFLFVGSDKGGRTAAVLFSFTSTCQRHDLDPFAYLRDVLARLANVNLPADDLINLLPDRWSAPADSSVTR
jgi:transposase